MPGHHHQMTGDQVNISGVYMLDQVENYGKYLLALDIPKFAVRNIETIKYVCNYVIFFYESNYFQIRNNHSENAG